MSEQSLLQARLLGFVRSLAGGDRHEVTTLAGQASTRRYHRVGTGGTPPTTVVMELPAGERPATEGQLPFLNMHRYLSARDFPVPRVLGTNLPEGLVALEDLGDQTLESVVRQGDAGRTLALYRQAIGLIGALQRLGNGGPDPDCAAFGRRFDHHLLRWELDHFREWLLEADRGVLLRGSDRAVLDAAFDRLAHELSTSPPCLVHRDFQSRNLMVVPGDSGEALRVIDFQDALLGPRVYDLVALLRDSYVELDQALVADLLAEFSDANHIDVSYITHLFRLQTVQRKLKDAGRFVQMDRLRRMPEFLPGIAPSLRYVREALLELPELHELQAVLARHLPEFR